MAETAKPPVGPDPAFRSVVMDRKAETKPYDHLRRAYEDLAFQTTAANAKGDEKEVLRLKPQKLAAFTAMKNAEKAAEQQEKERLRKRPV